MTVTTYADCLQTFRKTAGRDVSDTEITDWLEALEAHKRYLLARDSSLNDRSASLRAAREIGDHAQAAAIIAKRNAAMNYVRRMEKVGWVLNTFGQRPALGLESVLVGTQRAKVGARGGAAQVQAQLQRHYMAGFAVDLERTGHAALFASGAMDREVSRALWLHDQPDMAPVLARLPRESREIATVIRKWQEVTRIDANKAGAWIGKRTDYIVRQSHDSVRITRAGFDAWAAVARQAFDIATMMKEHGVVDEDKMLKATYRNLSTGNHLKDAPEGLDGFSGPGNLAKRVSQSRSITFKDADAWFDYNKKFGVGNLREAVGAGLMHSADSTGLMQTLGTNPRGMFDAIRQDVLLQTKAADNLEAVREIDSKRGEFDRYLSAIDGTMNIPGSAMWARRSANVRAWLALSKLGGMVLSQLNDVAVYASGARYQGRGFFSGMTEAVSGLGRDLGPQERRELAASLGVVLDNMAGELGRIGSFSEAGGMNKAMRLFMKLNLSEWWVSRMRTSAAFGMSHHMALQVGKDFAGLGESYQRVLGLYGITGAEWNVIRQGALKEVDGKAYAVPEALREVSDDVMRGYIGQAASDSAIARERRGLEDKLRMFFVDQTETLALEPDKKTRAILLQGTQGGTALGELMRFLMQFKSFTGAYMQKIVGRELFGRGYEGDSVLGALRHGNGEFQGMASLIATTTLMGYASMSLKDLAKGRTPRDPTESPADAAKIFMAAMVQGGGAGIYGDFLFGEVSRFGGGTVQTLAGPAVSTFGDVVDLYHKAIHGDDVAASAFNLGLANTPFLNLFYTRLALNYAVLWRVQEMMNPGYLRRTERRLEKDQAQHYLMPPSQVVR